MMYFNGTVKNSKYYDGDFSKSVHLMVNPIMGRAGV